MKTLNLKDGLNTLMDKIEEAILVVKDDTMITELAKSDIVDVLQHAKQYVMQTYLDQNNDDPYQGKEIDTEYHANKAEDQIFQDAMREHYGN